MTISESKTVAQDDVPDREELRVELEATRAAFHALLNSIPEADWRRKSLSTSFTLAELLEHVVHSIEQGPQMVQHARAGKDLYNLPLFITRRLNLLMTRWSARSQTSHSLARRYDEAHAALLQVLDGVRDDEWGLGASFFGEGYWTIEFIFQGMTEHFNEHAAQVRESLDGN